MNTQTALEAIRARIRGEWDNPALVELGPLMPDTLADVTAIVERASPSRCPECNLSWRFAPPARIQDAKGHETGQVRCIECKSVYGEVDTVLAHARAMSDALLRVRPLGGSELVQKVGDEYLADPIFCGNAIDQLRSELHEARCEVAKLKKASREIMPYLRFTIGPESPGFHPTMRSAVASFAANTGQKIDV